MEYLNKFLEQIKMFLTWWVILSPWEKGIRVRFGKNIKMLDSGIHFKIPIFDKVFIQTIRSRNVASTIQTISTKDNISISISIIIQYSIKDIYKMYNTLHHPEMTLQNIIIGRLSEYISNNNISECSCYKILNNMNTTLDTSKYGIELEGVTIATFAIVKTFRLIQDQSWINEGYKLDEEK